MQIVGYETAAGSDGPAALLVARDGVTTVEPLSVGRDLEYSLGDRHCAGAVDGTDHVRCENPGSPYCETHDHTWICARCTGTCLKAEMDCHQQHAVYFAAFAPETFKVGVTKTNRLTTRLREQGADRGAHIYSVVNGRIARELEADLAASIPIPDAVHVTTKIEGLDRAVNETAWQRLLADFEVRDTYEFSYDLAVDTAPVHETIAAGTVAGTKGRILLLNRAGGSYAVDLRDLVGYEVTTGASPSKLQSSLESFS